MSLCILAGSKHDVSQIRNVSLHVPRCQTGSRVAGSVPLSFFFCQDTAMSGLNASLGYFLGVVIFATVVRLFLKKWPSFGFILEFASSFMLVACWLEVQTIVEIGEWAGGLGPDVTVTILFVVLLTHGVICGATGNPNLLILRFLQLEATTLSTLLAVAALFLGAHMALLVAGYYWSLELTDMHMIKNLMTRECSTSLLVSLLQGFLTECVCALIFHLIQLNLHRRHALIRVPLIAVLLTFLSYTGKSTWVQLLSFRKTIIQITKHENYFKNIFVSSVCFCVHLFFHKAALLFFLWACSCLLHCSSSSNINVYAYICSMQPEATHQLTSTPPWPMVSPSSVLGLPGQSMH